jgi:hypothetical protein
MNASDGAAYTLQGTPADDNTHGVVIKNHQKVLRK